MGLRRSYIQLCWYIFAFLLSLTGCSNLSAPNQDSNLFGTEAPYCGSAQAKTYSGATTTISGNAQFYYRALDWTSSGCRGLCGNPVALNIPYAEVHVLDGSGNILQCGETDANGNFSGLAIPQKSGTYIVQVLSRSMTNKVKISVLEDIYGANPYSITTSFNMNGSQSSVSGLSLSASARQSEGDGKIPGGAFNIFADIYWANQFLRLSSGNANFVADKVTVYWKAGFNPYSYYNSPNALASFYVSSEDHLYILGGKNGDVKNSDTDHFDDSVIIHEYGHFLEAHYGHSDSPGGSHNGDFIIDPRLAWSEGWANYFQAAVLDNVVYATSGGPKGSSGYPNYVDTIGYKNDTVEGSGSSAGISIVRDLTEAAANAVYDRPGTNEGIFREFSISRTLFKALRAAVAFQAVWQAFTSFNDQTSSFTPPHRFMNFGLFNYTLNTKITDSTQNTNWQIILTEEQQKKDTSLYGNTLQKQTPSPSCSTVTMNPVADEIYGYDRSNQLMSNDFYTYYHDGSSKTLNLTYTTGASSTNVVDLNLYLYTDGYYYAEEIQEEEANYYNPMLVRTSKTLNTSSNTETETISFAGLSAGYYMIDVKASTLNKTSSYFTSASANYYLSMNSTAGTQCLVPSP